MAQKKAKKRLCAIISPIKRIIAQNCAKVNIYGIAVNVEKQGIYCSFVFWHNFCCISYKDTIQSKGGNL